MVRGSRPTREWGALGYPQRALCLRGSGGGCTALFRWVSVLMLVLAAMTTISSADGSDSPGAAEGLAPCPDSPNCVSSDAPEGSHHVAPLMIEGSPEKAWSTAIRIVSEWPRTTLVSEGPGLARFECRSALFRFVDDLELQLRADQDLIAVRSASRVGYSDFGVNRKRVESLREALQEAGVVR